MAFTVRDYSDLIELLTKHPQWRTDLRRLLVPDDFLTLPKVVHELAEAQRRTEERLERLESVMTQLVEAQLRAEARLDRVEQGLRKVKGLAMEHHYRESAPAIFGRWLRKGHPATDAIADHLHAAMEAGQISEHVFTRVLASDLLWGGTLRQTGENVVLVVEASWRVEDSDVDRAAERAAFLRRIGLSAIPVAAGAEWPNEIKAWAREKNVVIVQDGSVEVESWPSAPPATG